MKSFVLGIDGGGSKTEAILFEIATQQQIVVSSGGTNFILDGQDYAVQQLQNLITQIEKKLNEENGQVLSVCLGSAAILDDKQECWCVKELNDAFPNAIIKGVMDSRIALEGALNGQPGVIVVAGTGSIAHSLGPDQSVKDCGGWGPWFGDEGSGYAIGSSALRAVAMDMDGRGEKTQLTEKLKLHLQAQTGHELIDKVYGELGRKEVAALAIVVSQCAGNNDKVALRLLDEAGKHHAQHLLTLLQQTEWSTPPILSYAGGVFLMGDLILDPLKIHLGEWAVFLQEPCFSPSYGAVLLALKQLDSEKGGDS